MATTITRNADALIFTGALERADVAALWSQTSRLLVGIRRIDVTAVSPIDSAGIALLAELAARAGGDIAIVGNPVGLSELRAAYRLDTTLDFAT